MAAAGPVLEMGSHVLCPSRCELYVHHAVSKVPRSASPVRKPLVPCTSRSQSLRSALGGGGDVTDD
eukprot:362601-Rhodomonas_salina.1